MKAACDGEAFFEGSLGARGAVLRDEGHDPIETRRRERADNLAKSRAQQPITFKQMAETYLQAHGARGSTATRRRAGGIR
jgi:hypothetical protein